jgi:hypothetical protein
MNVHPIQWFLQQIPGLQRLSLLSSETADGLTTHYHGQLKEADNGAVQTGERVFMSVSALLIIGGMILILAHNWEEMTKSTRAALAIAPILAGVLIGGWILRCRKGKGLMEFAGIWMTVSLYAGLGLITQTYHLGGTLDTFVKVVLLATLLVPWLFDSFGAWVIQLAGMIAWCSLGTYNRFSGDFPPAVWLFPVLFVLGPVLSYWIRAPRVGSTERTWQGALLIIATVLCLPAWVLGWCQGEQYEIALVLLMLGCGYHLIGTQFLRTGGRGCGSMFVVIGWLTILAASLTLPEWTPERGSVFSIFGDGEHPSLTSLLAVGGFGLLVTAVISVMRARYMDAWIALLPAAILVADRVESAWMPVIVLAATSIAAMIVSIHRRVSCLLYGAAVLLIGVILFRFLHAEDEALTRGIIFISCGVAMGVLYWILRSTLARSQRDPFKVDKPLPRWKPEGAVRIILVALVFVATSVAVVGLPVGQIVRYQNVLNEGTSYRIDCTIYDPYDPFAGRYVSVSPNITYADGVSGSREPNQWYTVRADKDGFLVVDGASSECPTDSTQYLKSGFEEVLSRFYLNEEIAPEAEEAMREITQETRAARRNGTTSPADRTPDPRVVLEIRVFNGHAVAKELYIDNVPIVEYVRKRLADKP